MMDLTEARKLCREAGYYLVPKELVQELYSRTCISFIDLQHAGVDVKKYTREDICFRFGAILHGMGALKWDEKDEEGLGHLIQARLTVILPEQPDAKS